MTRSRATKPVQMACLTIGYQDYLLPADKAMKVMTLMQGVVHCRMSFDHRPPLYLVGAQPVELELKLIQHSQVRMPSAEVHPALGHDGSEA